MATVRIVWCVQIGHFNINVYINIYTHANAMSYYFLACYSVTLDIHVHLCNNIAKLHFVLKLSI